MLKNLSKSQKLILCFNLFFIGVFTIYFFQQQNYEFILYVAVIIFTLGIILKTQPTTKLSNTSLSLLSIWGLMHMSGGSLQINGDVLYNLILIPISETYKIFKYDQLVHAFGFGTMTLVSYELIKPYLKNFTQRFYLIIIASACGFGALNEIIEFLATVISPQTNVGGYINTSLDLVFNLIGSIIACTFIYVYKEKSQPK
jgi:uncharacterized membrane protein YjdF